MYRTNGSLIGTQRTAGLTTAPGVWGLEEQCRWRRRGSWPLGPNDDPYYSNVTLLLQMNGSNGSTTFTDTSSYVRTVSRFGDAQISTAQSKFGGSSALFDATGDYLTVPTSTDWDLPNAVYTIELFLYKTADKTSTVISSGEQAWRLITDPSGKLAWYFWPSNNGFTNSVLSLNTWHHVAVVLESGPKTTLYVNGVAEYTAPNSPATTTTSPLYIGRNPATTAWDYSGYIDSVRLTKGIARYTSNFTPPALPFPNG